MTEKPEFISFVGTILHRAAKSVGATIEDISAPFKKAEFSRDRERFRQTAMQKPLPFGLKRPWIDPRKTFDDFTEANLDRVRSLSKETYQEAARSLSLANHLRGVDELLEIAETANPPEQMPDTFGELTLPARDGWKVAFHYDHNGEIRYISHFITPDGQTIDFWQWNDGIPGRETLMAWCRTGDAAKLKSRGESGE